MVPLDSTGKHIRIGSKVRFRGQIYTIADFVPDGKGRFGTSQIKFKEEQHTTEVADEISVDLVEF